MRLKLHPYQTEASEFMLRNKFGAVILDTGLGKTSVSLNVLRCLRTIDQGLPALIVGPLRVIQKTWTDEAEKWPVFNDLKMTILHGPKKEERLKEKSDIYLINAEGLLWLKHQKKLPNWTTLIVDESTKFKTWTSARTRVLRSLLNQFSRRYILTATPAPNAAKNVDQIFSQWSLLDNRLGPSLTAFRREFCEQVFVTNTQKTWIPRRGAVEQIAKIVEPITLHQSKLDHLEMPPLIVNDIKLKLPAKCGATYRKFEKELFAEMPDKSRLLAFSGSERYTKCRQLANGQAYIGGETQSFHDEKVKALETLVESMNGKSLLILYQYKCDLEAIRKKLGNVEVINGDTKHRETDDIIDRWNAGEIPVLCGQPSAMSHGLNMQAGGSDVCWFSLCNCAETYSQSIDRLHRQGQRSTVKVHRLLMAGTIDTLLARQLAEKKEIQSDFLNRVKGH